MKKEKNNKGLVAVGISLACTVLCLSLATWMSVAMNLRAKSALRSMAKMKNSLMMDSISAKALNELRTIYATDGGSVTNFNVLNLLLTSSLPYSDAAHPRTFWKGSFQLDTMDITGKASGIFEAPETNPTAWLQAASCPGTASTPPACYYKVTVRAQVCDQLMGGRTKLAPAEPLSMTDPAWDPPCPAEKLRNAEQVFFINTLAPNFN